MSNTYTVNAACLNCDHKFVVTAPKGKRFLDLIVKCPNCECTGPDVVRTPAQ